ncbi:MAG: DUF4434 domain-containing protein [Candidatus Aminicenantes bacterium]|nr:DUF4434 domain-containing protein [Candidatus Aminicenantes bacterium]
MTSAVRSRILCAVIVLAAFLMPACRADRPRPGEAKKIKIEASVGGRRAAPGDRVEVRIKIGLASADRDLKVELLTPGRGTRMLDARRDPSRAGEWTSVVDLPADAPEGFYVVTASVAAGPGRTAGKAAWLVGRAVGDFFITSAVDGADPGGDVERYMHGFKAIGGNLVVVHDNINGKAWYPSAYCAKAAAAGSPEDRVGKTLELADRLGMPVLLSVVWDMTRLLPGAERWASQREVMREMWSLYGSHPSLFGFYDYQEGSGTYFAAHVREFSDAVKALDRGLYSACAPYLDDPLLAGYLAAIDSLDISIYQGAFEASYRPDNRKNFPVRRTRDFAALSAGAMRAAGKIALSHVELFGYLERRYGGDYLATPADAFDQIASASTSAGPDGITLFTWHTNVYRMGRTNPAALETGAAVEKGLRFYRAAAGKAAVWPGDVTLYIPYSDWWTDRWSASIVPALDALRTVGLAADIEPFIPPRGEEILPFYPYGRNEAQMNGWLARKTVLILADISGMQDTDSALLKAFVEKGGTAILFGPAIPYGDLFDREALVGGKEGASAPRSHLIIREPALAAVAAGGHAPAGRGFALAGLQASAWTPTTAHAAVVFDDGGAAVLVNTFGLGAVVTCSLSLKDAAAKAPALLLDIIDFALARSGKMRPFDWDGVAEVMDIAQSGNRDAAALAATNPGPGLVDLDLHPRFLKPDRSYELTDLLTGMSRTMTGKELASIRRKLRPYEALALSIQARR